MARVGIGPAPRIRWRTDADRALEPAIAEAAARLEACARGDRDRRARATAAHLAALRRSLPRSPFWLARLRAAGVSAAALERLDDLAALPPLERDAVADHAEEMVAALGPDLVRVHSSGSTGAPVEVFRDALDQVHMWACLRFWLRFLGIEVPPRPRAVLLCTLPSGLAYSRRAPLFFDGALHRISAARPEPLARLERVRPSVIFTDPEGLAWLVERPAVTSPALVVTSAQALPPSLRERASAHLRAPIVDSYATTETGPIAWACPDAPERFHLLAPDVHVEVVEGQLLVSRLRPGPWPVLRYVTGDRGALVEGACACGFDGRSITRLRGRGHVRFETPSGGMVDPWRLAPLLKHRPLRSFELRQLGPSRFRLTAVGDPGAAAAELEAGLRALGWPTPVVETRAVARLPDRAKHAPFSRSVPGRTTDATTERGRGP